jgi:hypothetical protein
MKFSDYVRINEEERSITISGLLNEIAMLEERLALISKAYKKETGKHHEAGFKPGGGNRGKVNK